MKLFSRKQSIPNIPAELQNYYTPPDAPKRTRKSLVLLIAGVVLGLALIVGAGLWLGHVWSRRDDNNDPSQRAQSEDRVKQSPQETKLPDAGKPKTATDGQLNETSPSDQQ